MKELDEIMKDRCKGELDTILYHLEVLIALVAGTEIEKYTRAIHESVMKVGRFYFQ